MSRAKITGIAVCVMVIASLLSLNLFAVYNISDLTGYNINLGGQLNISDLLWDNTYEYNIYFSSNGRYFRRLKIYVAASGQYTIDYGYTDNDAQDGVSYLNVKGILVTNTIDPDYRYIQITGGNDVTNKELLNIINRSATAVSINSANVADGYENMYEYINDNRSAVLGIMQLFQNGQEPFIPEMLNILKLCKPLGVYYNIFGQAIVVGSVPVIIIAWLKRVHVSSGDPEPDTTKYKRSRIGFGK